MTLMVTFIIIVLFALVVGSFLNVVIHRLPIILDRQWRRECHTVLQQKPLGSLLGKYNLLIPRSHCPACKSAIKPWENIPTLSFLILKGKCSVCKAKISLRYPLVELLSLILILSLFFRLGLSIQFIASAFLIWALISLTFIDFKYSLLPDVITLSFLWIGLALNLYSVFTSIQSAVIGAMVGYLFLWVIAWTFKLITGKVGMGHGDFKLFAMIGAWLGWQQLPFVLLFASIVGLIVGVIIIIFFRKSKRHTAISFGPYLVLATWVALLWGEPITRWMWGMYL